MNAHVLWHNSSTNETQLWFVDEYKVTSRATVQGEDGATAFVPHSPNEAGFLSAFGPVL